MVEVETVRVYRFGDTVAISVSNGGGFVNTSYLTPEVASNLAVLLADFAGDIGDVAFTESTMRTMLVRKTDDGATIGRE